MFLQCYCLISSPVSIWGLPISEMVASISYNANDLIFQYSKWTCPCWIWIQHHFGSSGFNRNVHNAKITTSKRGFLFVLIMPVQQVQEQKALILKTRKTWISFPIKKKHSPDIVCVLTLQYCNFTFSAHSWHTWLTNENSITTLDRHHWKHLLGYCACSTLSCIPAEHDAQRLFCLSSGIYLGKRWGG